MFGSDDQSMSGGRYQIRLVSGQMLQKSHEQSVQETLDEGAAQGWLTSVYWDTTPDR